MMKNNTKESYVAPETFSVKVVSENFLCNSEITGIDSERLDYGDPENLTW